ncbi:hypothetical protein EB796_024708 [Bugula neritina]|uniref:Uncharacterized protein n=1 Tax=Bugula neritina TaxID=10212 RepID=A0A7J7ITV7_BUGNE|nr:hypothetical protein EB796_024708 [Bugula neritina]
MRFCKIVALWKRGCSYKIMFVIFKAAETINFTISFLKANLTMFLSCVFQLNLTYFSICLLNILFEVIAFIFYQKIIITLKPSFFFIFGLI